MLCRFEGSKTPVTQFILTIVIGYYLIVLHLIVATIWAAAVWATPLTPLLLFYVGSWVLYLRKGEGWLFDYGYQLWCQHDVLANSIPFHQIPIIGAKKKD